jgi:hypothetical protein
MDNLGKLLFVKHDGPEICRDIINAGNALWEHRVDKLFKDLAQRNCLPER